MRADSLSDEINIMEKVRQFVVTHFYVPDPATVVGETSLLREGIVDSAGVLELVSFLEETFSIRITDEELLPENLDSLRQIGTFVRRKKGL